MGMLRLDRLLDFVTSTEFLLGLLWSGLAALAVALLLLIRTRWGQSRPIEKCLALSALVHLWLIGFSTTVKIVSIAPLDSDPVTRVALSDDPSQRKDAKSNATEPPGRLAQEKPWDAFGGEWSLKAAQMQVARIEPRQPAGAERQARDLDPGLKDRVPLDRVPLAEIKAPEPKPLVAEAGGAKPKAEPSPQPIEAPTAQGREGARAGTAARPEPNRLTPIERRPASRSRSGQTDMPSSLLERPLAMPRLTDVPSTPDPASALAGPRDILAKPPARPADATPVVPDRAPSAAVAGPAIAPDAASGAGDLKVPSMVMPGSSGPAVGEELSGDHSRRSVGPPSLPQNPRSRAEYQVPDVYKLRFAANRSRLSERLGAAPEVETAVKAALKWLAGNQEPDGRWSVRRHGGGKEVLEAGRDRLGAGSQADTGITGLALLAFAAAGHTHTDGPHQATMRLGVNYLVQAQGADGNLGGHSQVYEFMYCHAMATLAMSELAGMTGDQGLVEPLSRAVAYSLAAQDPSGGGWRYRPREPGDTSQLGWQVMALKSAELAGIPIPERTWQGAQRFLESVSGGGHRGLAAYRPGEEFTRSMTAEALVCRQFLGLPRETWTAREAGDYLLGALPGQGEANLYYWYYGSIAMYQLQGDYWKRWSEALQRTLLATQRTSGALSGSWDPNTRWDGYGGRVYSTALSALCLEAYYRFLPLTSTSGAPSGPPGAK